MLVPQHLKVSKLCMTLNEKYSHNFKKKILFYQYLTTLTQNTISIPLYPAVFRCKNANGHLKFQIIDEANAFLK